MSSPVAVYVHTPFCPSKCGYCDFNSYAMEGEIIPRTVAAMEREIRSSPDAGRPAKTIFFGGGTPTFLSADQITGLLRAVIDTHPPIEGAEITSEANPGTVDIPKFDAMRAAGFNRISLGAQSFSAPDLIRLGRVHDADHIARAVGAARRAGFDNVSIDLMFALPGQSMMGWRRNLEMAIALGTDHLSLYCLTIEPNTRFYRMHLRGTLDVPDDEAQVAMYDVACELTASAGLAQYEISNFAKPGFESQHNLCYWRGEEYAGYGPGAVGAIQRATGRERTTKIKHPVHYSEAVELGNKLTCEDESLGETELNLERLMLGIRLNGGIPLATLKVDSAGIASCRANGWLDVNAESLCLTKSGRHFAQEVALRLAP